MPLVPRSPGRFSSSLLTRKAGVFAAVAVLVILLGCMSISIGKFTGTDSGTEADGTFCQQGEVTVAPGTVREVFYPMPYAHPPHLEATDMFTHCVLVQQREDLFSVRNDASHSVTVSWKARGVKAAVIPDPAPPPPVPVPAGSPPGEATGKAR
jgi:hypothetical protein